MSLEIGNLEHLQSIVDRPVKEKKDTRARSWTFVLYPESAPENWRDLLTDMHLEWICSPLHDKDLNPTGEPKKPHFHLLLMFGNKKSYEQVCELIEPLNVPIPQRVHNNVAMVRYMVHMDNPEKAQYKISEITFAGCVDVMDMFKPRSSERYTIIRDMMLYVKENGIIEFQELLDYAMTERFEDWFPVLCDSSTYVISRYISSQRRMLTEYGIARDED